MAGWILDERGRRVWLKEGDLQWLDEQTPREFHSLALERVGCREAAYRILLPELPQPPAERPPRTPAEVTAWMDEWTRAERLRGCNRPLAKPKRRRR